MEIPQAPRHPPTHTRGQRSQSEALSYIPAPHTEVIHNKLTDSWKYVDLACGWTSFSYWEWI